MRPSTLPLLVSTLILCAVPGLGAQQPIFAGLQSYVGDVTPRALPHAELPAEPALVALLFLY